MRFHSANIVCNGRFSLCYLASRGGTFCMSISCSVHSRSAVALAGKLKPVSVHALRRSFASHLPQSGADIRTVQELLGYSEVSITMA
ncbi:Integrase, catalytic domain containing protein [Comamonadaceae bacterium]